LRLQGPNVACRLFPDRTVGSLPRVGHPSAGAARARKGLFLRASAASGPNEEMARGPDFGPRPALDERVNSWRAARRSDGLSIPDAPERPGRRWIGSRRASE